MIKILNTSQIKDWDAFTIRERAMSSIDLMEQACNSFVDWFVPRFDLSNSIIVVCGTGNNGGDGLGIARLLCLRNYQVKVFIVMGSGSESSEFRENTKRLPNKVETAIFHEFDSPDLPESDIIIDAIFGSGLSRPLEGLYWKVVSAINLKQAIRIAVDIPSGLYPDKSLNGGEALHAHHTVTFQLPKLSFLLPDGYPFVGEWHCVNIGLSSAFIAESKTKNFLVDEESIRNLIRPRQKYSHKGDFGHSLIIAGCLGKIGANILATRAALRTGSGLVTSLAPQCGYTAIQSSVPEAMVLVDSAQDHLTHIPDLGSFTSIGVGPGLGKEKVTAVFLGALLRHEISNCVIDADALNILSENRDMLNLLPPNGILTPHPGEFRRLVGNWANDFERLELQRALSGRLKSIIVLKGAHTSISFPSGDVYFNTTGNPTMATGGSGDVLTGILTSLLSQNYSPQEAAILGVYLHGVAGDLASRNRFTIIASDIIEQIPVALKQLTFGSIVR